MQFPIRENPLVELFQSKRIDKQATILLASYFFLALTSVSMVKALQKGIYLGNIGFDWKLPALYVALAVLSSPIVFLYRYLAKHYSHIIISSLTLITLAVGLTLFWLGRDSGGDWIYHAFFLWGAIFSVLVPTQGWIFSYGMFSPSHAKRVFVVLGTGGVLGGVVGGYYTAFTAQFFSSTGLFVHVFALLVLLQVVLLLVFFKSRKKRPTSSRTSDLISGGQKPKAIQAVFHSKHLSYLALLILLTGFCSTLVDLQFNWSLDDRFAGVETQITQFVGGLQGSIYMLSALIQLLATNRILRRFGLGLGLFFLPAGLLTGSLGMLLTGSFWSVVTAKGLDGSLRSSIEQTSVELLYVPISERQNIPVKSFVELVVLRFGDGLGAALFLLISGFVELPLQTVGLAIALVGFLWLFVSRRITEEYSLMLRRSLESADSRPVRRALELNDAVAQNTLISALKSTKARKVHFALKQLLVQEPDTEISDLSSEGLSGEVISMDVSGIYGLSGPAPRWLESVEPLVDHPDRRVGAVALHLVLSYNMPGYRDRLKSALRSKQVPEDRYLTFLQEYAEDLGELLDPHYIHHWCKIASPEEAVNLAYLIGETKNPVYLPILRRWVGNPHRPLSRAAIQALGVYSEPEDVELLLGYLAENWSRRAASKALSSYGDKVVGEFMSLIRDPKVNISVKREIPSVLTQIDTSSARGVLVASLYTHDAVVAYRALKGLNRIRDRQDLSYSQDAFIPLLQIWTREYYGLLNIDILLHTKQAPESRLLQKAIKERINWSLEKIFRGLDLFLPHGDAYFSYLGYTSARQDLREYAIELIDSRIKGELRQTLLPIFSELHPFDVVAKGREIFLLASDSESALAEIFFQADPWLKCCTIGAVKAERIEGLRPLIQQALEDINPAVRETAEWALRDWNNSNTQS